MINLDSIDTTIPGLQQCYARADLSPRELILALRNKALAESDNPVWIYLLSEDELEPYFSALEAKDASTLPLFGIPFAIKDNIDLAGIPTTAACPEFTYRPETSASVVKRLINCGAVPLGKTNMDQFATGLVGTRSPKPWGACKNVFNPEIISGGSSSGSAVALALGQVSFALGTDTAGSGRVPASLNNLVGLKPTRGVISTHGVVPACRSLDCVSIFALNTDDANRVFDCAAGFDNQDAFSRKNPFNNGKRYYHETNEKIICGIPRKAQRVFFDSDEAEALFDDFIESLPPEHFELVELDIAPFVEAAKLLYLGPWVSERWLATKEVIANKPEAVLPVIHEIISTGNQPLASDLFQAKYKLQALKQQADALLGHVDAFIMPTNPRYYSIKEVNENPIGLNSNLGFYTNFMNLLDYAAVAVPAGFYAAGCGFGVTLFQRAFSDKRLLSIAAKMQNTLQLPLGGTNTPFKPCGKTESAEVKDWLDIIVCGAHLQGQPLNWQLCERGAQLREKTHTSRHYRLFALAGGPPKRPGLQRAEQGEAIAVEVWRMPKDNFGSFVAEIPAPLGIGKIELHNGNWLSGFICDSWGLADAEDITLFGGWEAYLESQKIENA